MNKFLEDLDRSVQKTCCCENQTDKRICRKEYTKLPENPVVAMAYVPFQINTDMLEPDKALCVGTLFSVLNKPFLGGKCI